MKCITVNKEDLSALVTLVMVAVGSYVFVPKIVDLFITVG